jgi:hypothetical protein
MKELSGKMELEIIRPHFPKLQTPKKIIIKVKMG